MREDTTPYTYPEKETILKIQEEWEGFRDRAKELKVTRRAAKNKNGYTRESNLPARTKFIHMRPHARDAKDIDTSVKVEITKHCFWLNASYVKDEIYLK